MDPPNVSWNCGPARDGMTFPVDTRTRRIDLDIGGVQRLELVTTPGWDGFNNDHADWAAARVCPGRCNR